MTARKAPLLPHRWSSSLILVMGMLGAATPYTVQAEEFLTGKPPVAARETCTPHVRTSADGTTASLRPHHTDLLACQIDEPAYQRVIQDWLATRDDAAPLHGISLGRVANLPWLSAALATAALQHPRWNARRGRVRHGDINAFVAALLSDPAMRERLQAPFSDTGWRVTGVSVEKVLVLPAREVFPETEGSNASAGGANTGGTSTGGNRGAKVPFDAQLWLHLEHRP